MTNYNYRCSKCGLPSSKWVDPGNNHTCYCEHTFENGKLLDFPPYIEFVDDNGAFNLTKLWIALEESGIKVELWDRNRP